MTDRAVYSCRLCPRGNVIVEGKVFRVQRRTKHYGTDGPLRGKLVAVDTHDEFDIYCGRHYEEAKARGDA